MSGVSTQEEEDKKPTDQHINLKVKGQDGSEVFFRIKRSTQLKKLINAYCERQSVDLASMAFLFDGRCIQGEQTPDQLEMEDGDEIDAMLHQTGAFETPEFRFVSAIYERYLPPFSLEERHRTRKSVNEQLFEFGDKFRGIYDSSIGVAKAYYPSVSGYMDELLWGALWLYKATDKVDYLNYAISFGGMTWAMEEFSWDVKYAGVQVIAAMNNLKTFLQQCRSKAEYYICACLNKNNASNVDRTPGGLLCIRQWNNKQNVSTATFLLMAYSNHLHTTNQRLNCHGVLVGPDEIFTLAKSQVDYILGSNPMAMVQDTPKGCTTEEHQWSLIGAARDLLDALTVMITAMDCKNQTLMFLWEH
ncbi:hypothetical protein ACH5RR_027851 [Cinchona calisaya]|uniref:cellulase n=1 Tax=Cinchona calisaya TaxID=153742 RepID=A0ABD2YR39_9GENT